MSNQRHGVTILNDWRDYDALHPRLRAVVMRSPYKLATRLCTEDLRGSVEAPRQALIAKIIAAIGREALKVYGSDHPQAAASAKPVAPEWERRGRTGGARAARR